MRGAEFEKFQAAIARAGLTHIKPMLDKERLALGEAFYAEIFDTPSTTKLHGPVTVQDRFVGQVFAGFMEIVRSYERLQDIYFYAGRFPYGSSRASPERYLRYHIENYFAEVYVLRERLLAYLKIIERLYRREKDFSALKTSCDDLAHVISKGLEGLVDARGQHVHQRRLSDGELGRLYTIEFFAKMGEDDEFARNMRTHFKIEHRKVKAHWKQKLKQGNDGLALLLDMVFSNLYPFMFDKNTSQFRFPRRMATNSRLQRTPAGGRR